ncbi:MAG: cytochrome P450 [Acidimicrobiales bacterium]
MSLKQEVMRRVVMPVGLSYYQWRGDPLALLMREETKADPYPVYAEMRRRGLVRSKLGIWATAHYSTVASVLRDPRFSSSPVHQKAYRAPEYPEGDPRADLATELSMLNMDPPDHTRLRRLVSGAFSPRAIAGLEPWIEDRTEELLDGLDAKDGFDLIEALALPLPIAVICHLLGVPVKDQAHFRVWGRDIAASLEPMLSPPDAAAMASEVALAAYLRDLIQERRAQLDESLLSALIATEEEGDRLSATELVNTCLLLLVAGFETTVNLIGNGAMALIDAPDQWDRLRHEPELLPGAIEELLRYDSPVQATSRAATEDIELEGKEIPKGATIIVSTGGANRDPAAFDHPDRLDVLRTGANRHLSFSLGIHHCLGAALARLEGRLAIGAITRRFPRLELAGTPVRRPLLVLRGYESLPVRDVGSH